MTKKLPNQKEAQALLALFNKNDFPRTEILARELLQEYPEFALAWKILGVVLG